MSFFRNLWSRVRGFFADRFARRPPELPGQFVTGSKFSWKGVLSGAPWLAPQRDYLVYVPSALVERWTWRRHPLLVLLHGCRQTPEEIAAGTRVAQLADRSGTLVLLPRQHPRANPWGCWNWFDSATVQGRGETAIVASQIRAVRRAYRIDKKRVFVAGMSSGGALAAALGVRRPGLIAGVFVHSGVACGAAASSVTAMTVMANGADGEYQAIAKAERDDAAISSLPVPLVVVQGAVDQTVAPVNARQLVRQYLTLNGHPAAYDGAGDTLPPADRADVSTIADGRTVTTSEWSVGGRMVARHVEIGGLGHAWSGGDEQYPFNDAHGPDSTALLAAFIRESTSVQ